MVRLADLPRAVSPRVRDRRGAVAVSFTLGLICAGPALAMQGVSPATVTPQTLVPQARDSGFRVEIPEAGALTPPRGAETLQVEIGEARLEGGFVEVASQVRPILDQLSGHRVTLAQIYAAASEIEAIHARAGFVLARVSVPAQDLSAGGRLSLRITDGFIEAVDLAGLPSHVRAAVGARTQALQGRRHLRLRDIEQALMIASDTPGLTLRSTLMRGAQPGAARLVLEGEHRLFSGVAGADNQMDPSLDDWSVNLQLAANSPFGLGEQVYGFASSGYDLGKLFSASPRARVLGAGVVLPLGDGRFSLNPEVTISRTAPAPAAGAPATLGKLDRFSLRLNGLVVRTRAQQLGVNLSLDHLEEENVATGFSQTLSHDRYMAIRLGVSGAAQLGWAQVSGSAQFSQGLGGLDALTPAQAAASGIPYSRLGAAPDFTRLNAGVRAAFAGPAALDLALSLRGQTGFGHALFRAEQTPLEGVDGLSAYVGGRTAVDSGLVARFEASRALSLGSGRTAAAVAPYVFAAAGAGRLEQPTALESGAFKAANFGLGLRATLLRRLTVAVEYAHGVSDDRVLDGVDRGGVTTSVRF